ncbi:Methyl-CpG DNA-binding, partial [Sesbania bispinosa]
VVVEKGIAEGLPPGWMRKTRITTKGDTVRRDSYYIDPVSGYVFRSIKEVDRYLESGVIRRNAFKPKVKDSSDMELKDGKFSSAAGVTMKPTLSISLNQSLKPTLSVNLGQSSGLDMTANHQQIPRPASSGVLPMPISQHIFGVVGTDFTSSILSGAASSDQKEGEASLAESALVSGCTTESQEKQHQENSETKHGTEKGQVQNRQRKNKKDINLPRRASKRLAGIKVDPLPELKTRNRPRRAAVKQSDEEETITNVDKSPNSLPCGLAKQFNTLEHGSETKCKSEGTKNTMQSPELGQMRVLENGDNNDAKLNYTPDFPLREILTDPCIAFAIQTLTGVSFETSKNSQISSELKNSQHSETPAAAEGHDKKINIPGDDSRGCNVFPSPENFATPQAHGGDAKVVGKANENLGSSSENTLDISWMDPCIEFAIKTLTGTIPLDTDQNPKKCLQQNFNSSNTQHSEMALSSVSLDNSCQSDYYCNQYFGTQKPMFNQSFVDPTLQHTRNIGIGNSAGARLPHYGEDRRNVC